MEHMKRFHTLGIVVIEDDVEVGSNCTIDRATLGETRISRGVKVDNQVQIAHNVVVGEDTVIAAQTGEYRKHQDWQALYDRRTSRFCRPYRNRRQHKFRRAIWCAEVEYGGGENVFRLSARECRDP